MTEEKDLYRVLGVERGASGDAIRDAYRKLAREHHPDVNPNDPGAEDRFKEVSAAYGVLSNDEKRKRYDEFGMAGLQEGFDPEQARAYQRWAGTASHDPFHQRGRESFDFDDLLANLFGGAGPAGGPRRGSDAEGEIQVDFLDAVRGGELKVELESRGRLMVKVPPGADDGTRIRLAGQGGEGAEGGESGDLYLILRVRPHAFFTREGADLFVEVPVTIPELVLGASIEVPTPDGSVSMKIPPRSGNGRKLRLRDKGALRRGDAGRGDLYVTLSAQLPETEDEKLDSLATEMEALYRGADVRRRLKEAQ